MRERRIERDEAIAQLEPGARPLSSAQALPTIVSVSVAISLKRIADALDGGPSRFGINDIAEMIERNSK